MPVTYAEFMTEKTRSRKTARSSRKRSGGILFGTDFSEDSRAACSAAAAIARRIDEPLTLLHAVSLPGTVESDANALTWFMANRRNDLRQEADDFRKTGVEVRERVEAGRPEEVLVKCTQTERARLLVVSSKSRRGMDRWFLGSVAEHVAGRAKTPILVVRDSQPLIDWAQGKRRLKVFVCFNHTQTSEAALGWVNELLAIGPCEITIGYVDWPADEWARIGGGGPPPFGDNPPDVQAVLEREIKAVATRLLGEAPFQPRVEANRGQTAARLAELAREEEADLVVVGAHQYQGFERLWLTSVSRDLLHKTTTNVAVVPLVTDKARETNMAPPLRRVLVTTDFSDAANVAIPHAYSLLRGGGIVHLLHVAVLPHALPNVGEDNPASAYQVNSEEAEHLADCAARLRTLIPAESAVQGILTEIEVVRGRNVAEAIYQAAERLGVDAICMGTHGRSGLSKAIMGSVAEGVFVRSRRPLMVIRAQPK